MTATYLSIGDGGGLEESLLVERVTLRNPWATNHLFTMLRSPRLTNQSVAASLCPSNHSSTNTLFSSGIFTHPYTNTTMRFKTLTNFQRFENFLKLKTFISLFWGSFKPRIFGVLWVHLIKPVADKQTQRKVFFLASFIC